MSLTPLRNRDGEKMKVHNAELFVDTMQAADWSEGKLWQKAKSPKDQPRKPAAKLAEERVAKQREAFLEKQMHRERMFRQKLDVARKETIRQLHERQLIREKEFEKRFASFLQDNIILAHEASDAIRADEKWRQRKRERLFNEWTVKVFQPMQDQINAQLAGETEEEIEQKRRMMFQSFLDESNKKSNGLFRDIIIESDYDPMQQMRQATLKYIPVHISDDPTKNRSTREAGDRMLSGLLEKAEEPTDRRTFVSVEMWNKMESTPYGRYSNEDPLSRPTKPGFLQSRVVFDHYKVPRGEEGAELAKIEGGGVRGKKLMKEKLGPTEIAECFKLPDASGTPNRSSS